MTRVALVTGGQRGIGAAISEALKAAGRTVVANYAGNDAAAEEFTRRTGIRCYKFNVADFEACADAVKRIESEVGTVEILVNNAGITRDATMKRLSREQWDAVIDTNLGSCYNMCKLAWDGMTKRQFGRIVNIGSVNGQAGQLGQVNYAAAKSGIHGFTKALAQEGARAGITVNVVAPGYINTEMMAGIKPEVMKDVILPAIPVGRLGEPDEIARCVVFLASDAAGFITGATLSANGGQYMA